jgi:adenylate kinase family enzyme
MRAIYWNAKPVVHMDHSDSHQLESARLSMSAPFTQRTVVIGNSGSGKSTLAERLAALAGVPAIDLDLLHWEADGYGVKREEAVARQLVREAAAQPRWVIEGVFGWLAQEAMPRATALIWLDLPWSVCRDSLLARGRRRGGTETDFAALLAWAEAYWQRQTPSSFTGHLRLFENFAGAKRRMQDRPAVHRFLAELETGVQIG